MINLPGTSIIREFEYKIAEHCGVKYAQAVCNATVGILGVFHALGLRDSEVITTPLTWPGAMSGLLMLNCKLKFCDVEPESLTLNPSELEKHITPKTKAVFTADFLGYPAQLDRIKAICKKHKIWLIHDAASSFGSIYKKRFSGFYADATIFSFGAKKIFTIGEGGCIVTNKSVIHRQLLKHITHPERQNMELIDGSVFALNTSINPLAAEFGLKSFAPQLEGITGRQKRAVELIQKTGISGVRENSLPNYYKLLVNPKERAKILKHHFSSMQTFPFKKLIYQEDEFRGNKLQLKCPMAEYAIRKYRTINFNR